MQKEKRAAKSVLPGIVGARIPESCGLARVPPRPAELQQEGYGELFDSTTLIFDGVLIPGENRVILTCPPALNLIEEWRGARFVGENSGVEFPFEVRELDRMLRVIIRDVPSDTRSLLMRFAGAEIGIDVRGGDNEAFRDKKVLLTVSRDNDLQWITDWAEFYAAVHGLDSVLLFDNESSRYTAQDVQQRLNAVAGITHAQVVRWPFLWGPTAGASGIWDSNFGQHGAFETARWRFLRDAALVVNVDIDELVIPQGSLGLFGVCENSQAGAVHFRSNWVVGVQGVTEEKDAYRHRDFCYLLPMDNRVEIAKWAVQPRRATEVSQWSTHRLRGLSFNDTFTKELENRHFREINTGWKWSRLNRYKPRPDIVLDERMMGVFRKLGWTEC